MKKYIVAMSFVASVLFLGLPLSEGQTNPTWACYTFKYRCSEGHVHSQCIYQDASYYNASYTGWDNCLTNHGNHKFNHGHCAYSFPIYNVPADGGTITVTTDMVNAYWDDVYSDYTRIWGPSFYQNCHGWSTGWGCWLDDMATVLADDYQSTSTGLASVDHMGSHSRRVEAMCYEGCEFNAIAQLSEKYISSGVYRSPQYYCPGGAGMGTALYMSKP